MSLCSERKSVHDNSGPVGEVLEVHPGVSHGLKELRLPLLLQPVVQEDGGPGVMGQRKPRRAGLAAMRYEWAAPRGSTVLPSLRSWPELQPRRTGTAGTRSFSISSILRNLLLDP